jgi:hypothetical protein
MSNKDWQRNLIDPDGSEEPPKVWQVLLGWAVVVAVGVLAIV